MGEARPRSHEPALGTLGVGLGLRLRLRLRLG